MSDMANPYQSPEAVSVSEKTLAPQAALNDTMLRYLKEASPWLRFIGVLGFIFCGFLVVGGIIFTVAMSSAVDERWLQAGLGLMYFVIGALLFFPARFIYQFGAKVRSYMLSGAEKELEAAFKNNKSLWKFIGILGIINLAFVPVSIIFAIASGLTMLIRNGGF